MGSIFGRPPDPPEIKIPTPSVTRMPTAIDPTIKEAGRRQREMARRRTGRRSTILTEGRSEMGSSGATLGA